MTCPPGEYPNGIDYSTPGNLEILLQPGVVTRTNSEIIVGGNARLVGPTNTLLSSNLGGVFGAVELTASGSAFVQIDDVVGVLQPGAVVRAFGSLTFIADRVSVTGSAAEGVTLSLSGSTAATPGQVFARVNSIEAATRFGSAINVMAPAATVNLELGSVINRGTGDQFINSAAVRVSGGIVNLNVGTASTTGIRASGISAFGQDVRVVAGTVTTSGVQSDGMGISGIVNVSVNSGRTAVSGNGSTAINVSSTNGNVAIVSETVEVTGGTAIQTFPGFPPARVEPRGIFALAPNGNIVITSGSASNVNGTAIQASAQGDVTIVAGTTVAGGIGIAGGSSRTGTVTIEADSVTSGALAINASTGGSATVTVRNLTLTAPNAVGVRLETALASTVNLRGLATGPLGSGPIVQSIGGGAVTLNLLAGSTLQGSVGFRSADDRVNNSGIFEAIGNSIFGGGGDVFANGATGIVRAFNGATAFEGLETFTNQGLIDLRDGAVGDSLGLQSYSGSGGARLGLDVDYAAGTADRLVTGAATGATSIEVQPAGRFTGQILVVEAGPGSSPTAFSISSAGDSAYLRTDIRFEAATNDFFLVQKLGGAVFETARFRAMATSLWHESADAVAAQLDTVRDGPAGRRKGLWLQGWTAERERDGVQIAPDGSGTFDVSYRQDFQGLQGGFDFQAGALVVGITGGAGRSDATFISGNAVDMKVWNAGLYVQANGGPLFFNALAKFDRAELAIDPGPGLGAEFDADLFGVQANAGLRFDLGAVHFEPSVGLSWISGNLDSFESGPATLAPGAADDLRARAGLRVGARLPVGSGSLMPFAAVDLYEELGDGNASEFTLGDTLRLLDETPGTRGRAAIGSSFAAAGFEVFVRGESDFRGGIDAKAVRAGARLRF